MKNCWLNNKTFVVTGASSGLGKELVKILIANHGCKILGVGRTKEKFEAILNENKEIATSLEYFLFDVGERANWEGFAALIKERNLQIDGIINCAGVLPPFKRTIDTHISVFESVLKTDYLACVYAVDALKNKILSSSSPAIINVSSAAALATIVGTAPYSAAKSAAKSYTEALTHELKNRAYVALVMPGFAKTEIFREQNSAVEESKLLTFVAMDATKAAQKIYRKIKKRRTRIIVGKDAHLLNFGYKLFPRTTMLLSKKVLKLFKIKLFNDVFIEN